MEGAVGANSQIVMHEINPLLTELNDFHKHRFAIDQKRKGTGVREQALYIQ